MFVQGKVQPAWFLSSLTHITSFNSDFGKKSLAPAYCGLVEKPGNSSRSSLVHLQGFYPENIGDFRNHSRTKHSFILVDGVHRE